MMTIRETLLWGIKILQSKKIDSPRLDAEILLAFTLKKPREFLLTHLKNKLTALEISKYQNLISRRAHHEPTAYITGKKEFYGLNFSVNRNVLIPRPETETLVNEILEHTLKHICTITHDRELLYKRKTTIIDVGTGSGCIAITIARNMEHGTCHPSGDDPQGQNMEQQRSKEAKKQENKETQKQGNTEARKQGNTETCIKIFAIDSSHQALGVAKKNARLHNVEKDITFLRGNLLKPLLSQFHRSMELENLIVMANLPYLTLQEWEKTQPEIKKYEPRSALVGGRDGLKYYKMLLKQLFNTYKSNKTNKTNGTYGITYFFEINPRQKNPLRQIIKNYFPKAQVEFIKDLSGIIRVLKLRG